MFLKSENVNIYFDRPTTYLFQFIMILGILLIDNVNRTVFYDIYIYKGWVPEDLLVRPSGTDLKVPGSEVA